MIHKVLSEIQCIHWYIFISYFV